MKFSYSWLQEYIREKLPKPKKLAELLTMHSFEVGEVHPVKSSKAGAKQFNGVEKMGPARIATRSVAGGKDWLLDIDILPNRSDCFSHTGICRDIAAITNSRFQIPDSRFQIPDSRFQNSLKIEIKDKELCPRYTARVITNVKIASSPKWIQERLKICGLKPINNIVDILNYVMLEMGQPLHAFDLNKIESVSFKSQTPNPKQIPNSKFQIPNKPKTIIIRRARLGEKIITLDGEKHNLDEDILVIADLKNLLAIAGIKGGKKAEIDKKTKNIVIESANFDPVSIYKASRKLNLRTDASLRFEHKLDPNLTELAINRAVSLIQELAGGEAREIVDFYPKKVLPKKIKLDLNYIEKLLGVKISRKEIIKILKSLDFKTIQYLKSNIQYLIVEVPTFRLDISIPEDLIEEIGRIYGYENILACSPLVYLSPPKVNEKVIYRNKIKDILVDLGFSEIYNYSFLSQKDVEIYRLKEVLELENPISEKQKYLRPSLIPNLLKNSKENSKYFKETKIFEIGKIYSSSFSPPHQNFGSGGKEKEKLAGVIFQKGIKGERLFYEMKGIVDSLLNQLGIANIQYDDYFKNEGWENEIFHPQKTAQIRIDGDFIGWLGEISPFITKTLDFKEPIVVLEIDIEKLIKYAREEKIYLPPSKYPALIRDLAILVPRGTKVAEVLNEINSRGGPLIRDIDLFDTYEGENIPEGMKNLAFHFVYQSDDRTLTDKEVDEIQKKIVWELENELGWQIRK